MTHYSFNRQYNEDEQYYDWFKVFMELKDKSLDIMHDQIKLLNKNNVPTVETLNLLSSKWKWIERALDYDQYMYLLTTNNKTKQRYNDLSKRLKWLQSNATKTMDDDSITSKEKIVILDRLTKTESKISEELYKESENIKKNRLEWTEYQKNKFNFEAAKQKDLEQLVLDYLNGYIDENEYNLEIKDYPERLIQGIVEKVKKPLKIYTLPFDKDE